MLTLVGVGYNVSGHATPETRSLMEQADRLFYLVTDPATGAWIRCVRSDAVSLHDCYRPGESGVAASNAMVERLLQPLSESSTVCAAFYGHPAIGMHTTHEVARRAREMGVRVRMHPGISFEDCMIADLGTDPGQTGRMMYEATDFVLRPRPLDTAATLVLLQIGAIGDRTYREGDGPSPDGLRLLQEVLQRTYPGGHEVTIYEISQLPTADANTVRTRLDRLVESPVHVYSTLFVPPLEKKVEDREIVRRLGLETAFEARA